MAIEREEDGRYAAGVSGNPAGRPVGSLNKATRFKNKIFDILEDRHAELSVENIIEIAKLGAKFVPKSLEVKGEMEHRGFIENMIKQAEKVETDK